MANSRLDIRPPYPAIDPALLTPEQRAWLEYLEQLYPAIPPEWGNVVPDAPGGQIPVGGTPAGPMPSQAPLPASQVPANPGSFSLPGEIASQGASQAVYGADSGGILSGLKNWITNPKNAVGLGATIAGLAGGRGGGSGADSAERLNRITEQRMQRVDPLHQAVTQLAWSRLPTGARQGITPPTYSPLK